VRIGVRRASGSAHPKETFPSRTDGVIEMLSLHIEAKTAEELHAAILVHVGAGLVAQFPTEVILSETRQRLAAAGTVVKLVPFDAG
jgi:hypothetical protein